MIMDDDLAYMILVLLVFFIIVFSFFALVNENINYSECLKGCYVENKTIYKDNQCLVICAMTTLDYKIDCEDLL